MQRCVLGQLPATWRAPIRARGGKGLLGLEPGATLYDLPGTLCPPGPWAGDAEGLVSVLVGIETRALPINDLTGSLQL